MHFIYGRSNRNSFTFLPLLLVFTFLNILTMFLSRHYPLSIREGSEFDGLCFITYTITDLISYKYGDGAIFEVTSEHSRYLQIRVICTANASALETNAQHTHRH
jgi:hypothetical protein